MSKRKKEYATDVLKREIEERKKNLKPCPFCNGEAKVAELKFGLNAVYCDSCGAKITAFYMGNAIIAWNKRVDMEE
jgi:transcription elongation factor Elf1